MYERFKGSNFLSMEVIVMGSLFGLLALVALPTYLDDRAEKQAAQVAEQFRNFGAAFQSYMNHHGHWPPDNGVGSIPVGMEEHLAGFTEASAIGGHWDWHCEIAMGCGQVRLVNFNASKPFLQSVDQMLDDGDLAKGNLFLNGNCLIMLLK